MHIQLVFFNIEYMKKILLLLLLFLSTSLIEVEAQGIIGKWRLPQQKKNGLECWAEIEFNPNNIVTAVLEFITKDESYSELGVIIDFAAEVHGKYEHSGKALCVDYDLNSPKIKKFRSMGHFAG